MKNLKFWGKTWLQELAMIAGIAFLMLLFVGIGWKEPDRMGSGAAAQAEMLLSLLPWYLMIVGGMIAFMSIIGCFMVYLPALLSVNCTRKGAFLGLMAMHLALIGAVEVLCWIIWSRAENDLAVSGRELLLPAFGWLLAAVAAGGILGCAVARWGKLGIVTAAGGLFGGGIGLGFYAGYSDGFGDWFANMAHAAETNGRLFLGVSLGGGAVLFLLMAFWAAAIIRKMEARL